MEGQFGPTKGPDVGLSVINFETIEEGFNTTFWIEPVN